MSVMLANPLDELDRAALYSLLGDAWCAQFEPEKGVSYCIESNRKIGEREFMAIVRFLPSAVEPTDRLAVMRAVTRTIKDNGFWRMPAYVVAALIALKGGSHFGETGETSGRQPASSSRRQPYNRSARRGLTDDSPGC